MIFGALYGLSTIALYGLLSVAGHPAYYDKLLQVPLLNLSIKWIDKAVRVGPLRRFDPAMRASVPAPPLPVSSGRKTSGVGIFRLKAPVLSKTWLRRSP